MKAGFLCAVTLILAGSAHGAFAASPFDSFVGQYTVELKECFTNSGEPYECGSAFSMAEIARTGQDEHPVVSIVYSNDRSDIERRVYQSGSRTVNGNMGHAKFGASFSLTQPTWQEIERRFIRNSWGSYNQSTHTKTLKLERIANDLIRVSNSTYVVVNDNDRTIFVSHDEIVYTLRSRQ